MFFPSTYLKLAQPLAQCFDPGRNERRGRRGQNSYPGILAGCCAWANTATASIIAVTKIDDAVAFFIAHLVRDQTYHEHCCCEKCYLTEKQNQIWGVKAKFAAVISCLARVHTTIDSPEPLRYVSATMASYIARTCPRCRDYFCVTVTQTSNRNGEHLITAYCAVCSFQLKGWRLIVTTSKQPLLKYSAILSKVFQ